MLLFKEEKYKTWTSVLFIFGYVAALFIKATMTAEAGVGHEKNIPDFLQFQRR